MDKTTEIIIVLLVFTMIAGGGWWFWSQQRIEKELTQISVDGEAQTISAIRLPMGKEEAWEIIERFCKPKNQEYEYSYKQMKQIGDEWKAPILNINCVCGATVNVKTGETKCRVDFLSTLTGKIVKEDYVSAVVWAIEAKNKERYVLIGEKASELIAMGEETTVTLEGYITTTTITIPEAGEFNSYERKAIEVGIYTKIEEREGELDSIPYEKTLTRDGITIGYRIKYPSDWAIKEDIEWFEGITTVFVPSNEIELENPLHNFIVFVGRPESKRTLDGLKEFVIKDSCDTVLKLENTTVGFLSAYKLKCVIDDINSDVPPLVLGGPLVSIEIFTLKPIEILGEEGIIPARAAYVARFDDYLKYIDEISMIFDSFEIL